MTATKEQERAALAKIEKIIKDLGPGSYLETTFNGILEQAADNITNDFGCNYKEAYETATDRINILNDAIKKLENERNDLNDRIETLESHEEAYMRTITGLREEVKDWEERQAETIGKLLAATNQKEAHEAEIITLKAKLYDLMTQ